MRAVSLSLAVALCVMAQCVVASAGASCNNQAGRVPPEVYQAEVIVTGLEEAERLRGFREALEEIVLKATAQPAPVSAGILREIAENPKYYVAQFCYEDRNRHLKTNDEQGTRDRPHFLRVTADLARLQAALVKASLSIWSERPNIQVMLTVNTANARFLLADESEAPRPAPVAIDLDGQKVPVASAKYEGYEQRETLKLIGKRRGLPIQLPQSSAMAAKSGGQPLEIGKLFPADGFGTGTVRYRGYLQFPGDGAWRLVAKAWRISDGKPPASSCFTFDETSPSFSAPLDKSMERLAAWLQTTESSAPCESSGEQ